MKLYHIIFISLLTGFSNLTVNAQNESSDKNNGATGIPDRVMLTMPGDPASSRAVTWRTDSSVSNGQGQITEAKASPFFSDMVETIQATSSFWQNDDSTAIGHQVIFENLKPNTMYTYRVGSGENWSEWFQFTTASDKMEPFSFIYLGDFQNDIKQHCSRIIRQAYSHFPDAGFILLAGDLASRSSEAYWSEFFYAGDWIWSTKPIVATPGNHEYYPVVDSSPRLFSKHWNQIFTFPENGPDGLEDRTYFFDYQGVRFISLDSPALSYQEEGRDKTVKWLKKILSDNPNEWTIVFTHYPVYSCSQGRDNFTFRNTLKPILEEFGVDLVLQGHDHTYCRGQNLKNVSESCKNPPLYMVSVSGPKMYGLNVNKWSDRVGSQLQLYQNITVENNTMEVEVYTVTGQLYDAFKLNKNEKGINEVIESPLIQNISEQTEIPERALGRYTEDEKLLYEERYNSKKE